MSSDYAYISEHMGGWNDDTGLPNFMDDPGFSDDLCDEKDEYDNEEDSNNLEVEFDIGDTVNLNSSDVLMTIKSIDGDILTCRWFDKNDTLQSSTFNIVEIDMVEKIQEKQLVPTIVIDENEIPF